MEEKTMQVMKGVKPNVVNWIGALIGAAAGFFAWSLLKDNGTRKEENADDRVAFLDTTVLQHNFPLPQNMPIPYAVLDIRGHILMYKESGKVSSSALPMGVMKKGLEWLVVGVCVSVGNGLGVTSVCGAAMTYMIATELVSLIENLEIFGLNVPLLGKLLDVAQGDGEKGRAQGRQ